jgi:hypothetical protein
MHPVFGKASNRKKNFDFEHGSTHKETTMNEASSNEFEIIPLVGFGKLRFGMTPEDVASIAGKPSHVGKGYFGGRVEYRHDNATPSVTYDKVFNTVTHFGFGTEIDASFKGKKIFQMQESEALFLLAQEDSSPYECFGSILFLKLGMALSEFHGEDIDDRGKAISMYNEAGIQREINGLDLKLKPFLFAKPILSGRSAS